jgi:succinoglycan biosynthesis protein ExoA
MRPVRSISIVVPTLNEVDHVDHVLADLEAQDFRGETEVLVADGGSTDGTLERLRAGIDRVTFSITLIENPARWVSHGLNLCIGRASGDLIVRLDCHSRYAPDYLTRLVRAAEETDAWNVGGVVLPEGRAPMERAVACAMESPFGGIGWTRAASSGRRIEVDTVTFGAFRPEAFERAGLFDETLVRNQDDELNLRLRMAGGRIVLDPTIVVRYQPRGSLSSVFRQYYEYGVWKVPVMLKHRRVLGARSLAPVAMVASLGLLTPLALTVPGARRLVLAEVGAYTLAAAASGAASLRRRREPWRLLPRVVAVYPAFHLGYGIGMARGFLAALGRNEVTPSR